MEDAGTSLRATGRAWDGFVDGGVDERGWRGYLENPAYSWTTHVRMAVWARRTLRTTAEDVAVQILSTLTLAAPGGRTPRLWRYDPGLEVPLEHWWRVCVASQTVNAVRNCLRHYLPTFDARLIDAMAPRPKPDTGSLADAMARFRRRLEVRRDRYELALFDLMAGGLSRPEAQAAWSEPADFGATYLSLRAILRDFVSCHPELPAIRVGAAVIPASRLGRPRPADARTARTWQHPERGPVRVRVANRSNFRPGARISATLEDGTTVVVPSDQIY